MRIWGRKTRTEPTPAHTPSMRRSRNQLAGSCAASHSPEEAMPSSTPSMIGVAHVKMAWNTSAARTRNTAGPAIRCRKSASRRCVSLGGPAERYFAEASAF